MQGSVSKWHDALSKQSCELFVAKVGSACPRPDITRHTRNQHFQTENKNFTESYRSGHNELDSKSSCGLNRTRVRIPHSPPNPDRKLLGFLFESVPPRVALVFQSKLLRLAITAQVPTNPSLSAKTPSQGGVLLCLDFAGALVYNKFK